MVGVVEGLELAGVSLEIVQITELMSAEEDLVVDVVEALDNAITPRLSFRNEDDFNSHLQTGAQEQSQASWIAIGAAEGEFVVQLEVARESQSTPSMQEALYNGLIVLRPNRFERNGVAVGIDEVKSIKPNTAVKIPGTDQIQLMNNIPLHGTKAGIGYSPRSIGLLGREAVSLKNPINRP